MTNPYESTDADSYETSGTTYANIEIPSFPLDTSGVPDYTSTTSTNVGYGSSFLRLGSFPTTSDDEPNGFDRSYTLAKLVGDTGRFSNQKGYAFTNALTVDKSETSSDVFGVIDSVIADNPYMGDKSYLVGFADDTRSRDTSAENIFVDGQSSTNTVSARKTETQRILSKGGTWDHSDGNRITTTGGDKIEIVQGNYKLVVLGRQNPASTKLSASGSPAETQRVYVSDISGGRDSTKVGGYDPGDFDKYDFVKIYEWLPAQKTWASYEYNNPKHTYSSSSGISVSVFKGTKRVSRTGYEGGGWHGKNPEVTTKTWAERVESYTGAPTSWVKHAFSLSYVALKADYSYTKYNYSVKPGSSLFLAAGLTNLDVKYGTMTATWYGALEQIKLTLQPLYFDIKWGALKTELNFQNEIKLQPYSGLTQVDQSEYNAESLKLWHTDVEASLEECEVDDEDFDLEAFKLEVLQTHLRQHGITHT